MMNLFSSNGLRLLESLCFTRTLFAFDFDGTLSKIVKEPDRAKINDSTLKLLLKLEAAAPVAIISGRSLNDLRNKFSVAPKYLVGNHGLEGLNSKDKDKESFAKSTRAWKEYLARRKDSNEVFDGVEVEDKTYSLAIHYRNSRQKGVAKKLITELVGQLRPVPRVIPGKCVVNVVPVGGPHKGISLLELMARTKTRSAFYIGDDDTDEDVFALPEGGIFPVRVGKKASSSARYFIESQSDINPLLEKLIEFQGAGNLSKSNDRRPLESHR